MNFFRYVKIVLLKMHASGKIFDRICLKADGDSFFFQYRYGVRSEDRGTQFFGAGNIQQKGKVQNFWLAGRPPKFPPLLGHPDLSIRKTLRRMLDLLTAMILKSVSEYFFFQINIFTAFKFKDKNEVANSSMAFNLLKIIHPFQGKKHLRT